VEQPTAPSDDRRQADWRRRAAVAEINARRVNEAIERGDSGPAPVFVCECGYLGCNETTSLSIRDYESVRTDFDRFFLIPGHEIDTVDRVVERYPEYLVVVKLEPEAKEMAREGDQRAQ
jgi:hypothetical protein